MLISKSAVNPAGGRRTLMKSGVNGTDSSGPAACQSLTDLRKAGGKKLCTQGSISHPLSARKGITTDPALLIQYIQGTDTVKQPAPDHEWIHHAGDPVSHRDERTIWTMSEQNILAYVINPPEAFRALFLLY